MTSSNTKHKKTKRRASTNPDEIGIYDTQGINNNPFTGKPYENHYASEIFSFQGEKLPATYANYARSWSQLPMYAYRDEITQSIRENQVTLVRAGTGVGKTVIIPKLALHAFGYTGRVITTIPKRLIAKSTAERDAKWMDSKIGEYVGYYFKGVKKTSDQTKLLFTTTGSLLSRMTGDDPYLSDYKVIIIDEAHERSVQTDQVLLLVKNALEKRPDLHMVIMSATIDSSIFSDFFKGKTFKLIDVPGISFPITHYWLPVQGGDNWYDVSVKLVMQLLKTTTYGDILIFGKAGGDAGKICGALAGQITSWNRENPDNMFQPFCVKLASNSTGDEEHLATDQYAYLELEVPGGSGKYTRKVVVSTNVAESSLTVNGIVYVIDSGLEYTDSYQSASMVRSLIEEPATQASITQRAGRAGRVAPGFCYHLYSEKDFLSRPKYSLPSIQKSNITSDILDLLKLEYIKSEVDLKKLLAQFISPPSTELINSSLRTLRELRAIDQNTGAITEHGRQIASFRGILPSLASAIMHSWHLYCWKSVIDIVAGATVLDGQFDGLFVDLDSKKKKDAFQVLQRYQIIRRYYHPRGDYFTILNVIRAYNAKLSELKAVEVEPSQDEVDDLETEMGLDSQLGGGSSKTMQVNNIDKWCRSQFISAKKLRMIKLLAKDLSRILKGLDKKPDSDSYKKYDGLQEDDKITCALVLGNLCNLAVKQPVTDGKKSGGYKSIFPMQRLTCNIAPDSSIKNGGPMIMYYELFTTQKNAKTVKANVVTQIPEPIINLLELRDKIRPVSISHRKQVSKPKTGAILLTKTPKTKQNKPKGKHGRGRRTRRRRR